MAEITAALVKDLREKTGVGMMDCKKALAQTNGDLEAAVDWLRKQGLASAAKKSGRIASEGLVGVVTKGTKGAVVEVNAETDFVARNEQFQDFVQKVTDLAVGTGDDIEALKNAKLGGASVGDTLTTLISTIGENMNLRRATVLSVSAGIVVSYMHNALKPGLGKIGVLVALESKGDASKLEALGKQLAMHVAAANPTALKREDVSTAELEREKAILVDQARASGRPENIIEKMVEGRMRKYYEDVCLLEQTYVIDGESKVGDAVKKAAKDVGAEVTVTGFRRFALGEGIEKKQEDFAAEVAAAVGA
jgi:elongation factor Ts